MPLSSSGPQNMVKPGIGFSIDSIVGSTNNKESTRRHNNNSSGTHVIERSHNQDHHSSKDNSKECSDIVHDIGEDSRLHITEDSKEALNISTTTPTTPSSPLSPYTSLSYGNNLLKAHQQQQQQQQQQHHHHHHEANNHHRLTSLGLVDRVREPLRYPYPLEPALVNLNQNYANTLNGLFNGHFNGPRGPVPTHYPHTNHHQLIRFLGHPFHPIPNPFFTPYFRKPKRVRTAFNPSQLMELERAFDKNNYVIGNERKELAKKLGLNETQVKVWFQNRRTKQKRQKQEEDDGTYQVSNSGKRNEADESECMTEGDEEEEIEMSSEVSNGYQNSSPKHSSSNHQNDPHR